MLFVGEVSNGGGGGEMAGREREVGKRMHDCVSAHYPGHAGTCEALSSVASAVALDGMKRRPSVPVGCPPPLRMLSGNSRRGGVKG